MKLSLKELLGYTIETLDGTKGKIKDFLLDEERWTIRYAEVDLGTLFTEKRILIPRMFLKETDWHHQHLTVELSNNDLEKCPEPDNKLPISREYEEELNRHYRVQDYWVKGTSGSTVVPGATIHYKVPPKPARVEGKVIKEDNLNSCLRSFSEIMGYHILTKDSEFGKVSDLLINTDSWEIMSVVVDTNSWVPWSKKVILATQWIEAISYPEQRMEVNLPSDAVLDAPEYKVNEPVNKENGDESYDFRGKPV